MTKKKVYIKGYVYWFCPKSFVGPSQIVLENKLPYGQGRLESQIWLESNGLFSLAITDGYDWLYNKNGFTSIKQAMNIAHGKMQELTHKTYESLD